VEFFARFPGWKYIKNEAVMVGGEWRIQLPNGVSVDFSGTVDAGSLSTIRGLCTEVGSMTFRFSKDLAFPWSLNRSRTGCFSLGGKRDVGR